MSRQQSLAAIAFTLLALGLAACSDHHSATTSSGGTSSGTSKSSGSASTSPGTTADSQPNKVTPGSQLEASGSGVPQGIQLRPVVPAGVDLTKESEGFVGHLYNDAASYCSVAYGHLVHKSPCDGAEPSTFIPTVSLTEGSDLLVTDMGSAQYAVMQAVTIQLTDDEYAALVDFTYNVGAGQLDSSTLLKLINAQQFTDVPDEWSRWVIADGKTYPGLVTRRGKEIDLFFDGHLPAQPAAPAGEKKHEVKRKLPPIDIRVGG